MKYLSSHSILFLSFFLAKAVINYPISPSYPPSVYLEKNMTALIVLLLLLSASAHLKAEEAFDIRQHLSTATRYEAGKEVFSNIFETSNIPDQCTAIHLNLVARHGTRAPTKKRIKELNGLGPRLKNLLGDAEERKIELQNVPAWFQDWKSPWEGKLTGGELIIEGEDELYNLGIRMRDRFPQLFNEDYHSDVYAIKASQIPRASASAVAFGMGLFSGRGNLGQGRHRAFAVTSESRASDVWLRFHDCCKNYKAVRKSQEPAVDKLKEPVLDEITSALVSRYGLKFTRRDISSLWFLCKQEASLLNVTNQACSLFDPSEVSLLEWTDDLEQYILKGYGNALNYRMGVPLLEDVVQSMEQAIKAKEEGHPPGSYEKARLRFAHAETLIPFSCLLGLFLEGSEFSKILKEQPLEDLPKPPQKRNWRGSVVAPFAGNTALVLYSCGGKEFPYKYYVQILHNEHPVQIPGCDNSDFCPFEVFKKNVVAPHLKHDYNTLCNKGGQGEEIPSVSVLSQIFGWFFPVWSNAQPTHDDL